MIGLDTNILARYYIQDNSDQEAQKQHLVARCLIESNQPLMVCKTVILELEWVMRGYYRFEKTEIAAVFFFSFPRSAWECCGDAPRRAWDTRDAERPLCIPTRSVGTSRLAPGTRIT